MIARLKGILDEIGEDRIVIDVSGVGYLVHCPARVIEGLPAAGNPVSLHIETDVREDHIHLFGFASARERELFRLLTTVQGVGARVGLALLGALSADELVTAVLAQDKAVLARAEGVGPRLAARLAAELKDRIVSLADGFPAAATPLRPAASGPDGAAPADALGADAVSALVNLGYGRAEAFAAVRRAAQDAESGADLERLIPAALRELGR